MDFSLGETADMLRGANFLPDEEHGGLVSLAIRLRSDRRGFGIERRIDVPKRRRLRRWAAGGAWDGEVAYLMAPLTKRDLFTGGVASAPDAATGRRRFREGLVKAVAGLRAVTPFHVIVLLEGDVLKFVTCEPFPPVLAGSVHPDSVDFEMNFFRSGGPETLFAQLTPVAAAVGPANAIVINEAAVNATATTRREPLFLIDNPLAWNS